MNEDLIKRLEASIRIGAIDGDATERQIFECQVVAAISALREQQAEIDRLRSEIVTTREQCASVYSDETRGVTDVASAMMRVVEELARKAGGGDE